MTESSAVQSSPRTEKLIKAEQATLEEGGVVMRLAGEEEDHTVWSHELSWESEKPGGFMVTCPSDEVG